MNKPQVVDARNKQIVPLIQLMPTSEYGIEGVGLSAQTDFAAGKVYINLVAAGGRELLGNYLRQQVVLVRVAEFNACDVEKLFLDGEKRLQAENEMRIVVPSS